MNVSESLEILAVVQNLEDGVMSFIHLQKFTGKVGKKSPHNLYPMTTKMKTMEYRRTIMTHLHLCSAALSAPQY